MSHKCNLNTLIQHLIPHEQLLNVEYTRLLEEDRLKKNQYDES